MIIERPPFLYRVFFPGALWRLPSAPGENPVVYMTFDDGPIPEITPWVLEQLALRDIKATFFMVADNIRKHPDVFKQVLDAGHGIGNHTYHHIQGLKNSTDGYMKDIVMADDIIKSPLFRPPHGHLKWGQYDRLRKYYQTVQWDVVTHDYSRFLSPERVLRNVTNYVRNGSIIVFHDSLKAERNMKYAMPRALDWLLEHGYRFDLIPGARTQSSHIE